MKKMMLYAKDGTVVPSNEEQVGTALLIIDEGGTVTGVTDKTKLNGTLALPAEIYKIKEQAFEGCTGLMSVNFSACTNLTEIGWGAFDGCTGLTGVLDLSACTSLAKIGDMAFENCTSLNEVRLPASLTQITGRAFSRCNNVQTLIVDPANKTYCSKDNVLYTKDMKKLICAAGGMKEIVIPDTVTEIGEVAFSGCTNLMKLDISAYINLTEIGEMAFENCTALTEVRLPANLSKIGWRAFNKCNNVHTLTVDPANTAFCSKDNVLYTKDMNALVYAAEGITQVCIPDTVTEICNYAFEGGSSLQTLTIDPANQVYCSKNNIIYTKDMTILVCAAGAITQAVLPDTLIEIGCSAFEGYKDLTSVDFSACTKLTKIGRDAFSRCTGLMSLDLSSCTSLTAIKGEFFLNIGPFANCTGLTEVLLPASLTSICPGAFTGCTKLAEIRFPAALTEIGNKAFSDCTGLTEIDFSACTTLTRIGRDAFRNIASTVWFNIPNESVIRLLTESGLNLKKQ
jgi:surface protein, putative